MSKRCPIRDTFTLIAPYWHIATGLGVLFITVVLWVGKVDSAVDDIEGLNGRTIKIERKLDYLMYRMGYPYEGGE